MDGESSNESDLSESWSLIDVSLNEESVTSAEACSVSQCEDTPLGLNNAELKGEESVKPDEYDIRKDKNLTANSRLSDSDSSPPDKNELDCAKSNRSSSSSSRRQSEQEGNNDSCDTESIEILDLDENNRDTDVGKFDISFIGKNDFNTTYHSDDDDEESFYEGNGGCKVKRARSAVIKRKRRKLSSHSDSSKNSVNSDCMFSSGGRCLRSSCPCGNDKSDNELRMELCHSNSRQVYKHYRNNVANSVLTLSMGVIFAGVACIAIGHFLGVNDAGETAEELMETLKKLQMENIVLQSRLNHLNRAYTTRELNSKLELASREENIIKSETESAATERFDERFSTGPRYSSTATSIEWLAKLQNLVNSKSECLKKEDGVELNEMLTSIRDQLTSLNGNHKKSKWMREVEESDRKISKVLQKIIDRLTSSQDNIENLYRKLVKLKSKLNRKLSKVLLEEDIFPEESKAGGGEEKRKKRTKKEEEKVVVVPVTKRDLLSIQWKTSKKGTRAEGDSDLGNSVVYRFPQAEKYYSIEENNSSKGDNYSKSIEKVEELRVTPPPSHPQASESIPHYEMNARKTETFNLTQKIGKTRQILRKNKKSEDKEEKSKEKKEEKRRRHEKSIKLHKGRNKYEESVHPEPREKVPFKKVGEAKFQKRKKSKVKIFVKKVLKELKPSKKSIKKKSKKLKFEKVSLIPGIGGSLRKEKEEVYSRMRAGGFHPEGKCFNSTGYWMFKWADGRQEFRRYQTQGSWQFDRAKGRKELRGEDFSLGWQFKRALARENNRNYDYRFYEGYNMKN